MSIKKISLKVGTQIFPIYVGKGALKSLASCLPSDATRIFLFSDQRLKQARQKVLQELKQTRLEVHEFKVKAGEELKELTSLLSLYEKLLLHKADRHSVILALGGGTMGDAIGFLASTYMRGIRWIGIPTTLLAQVDSSVGGKTSVNLGTHKNIVGAFHLPNAVICEIEFLKTLGSRERISGLGEVVKYAFIYDRPFYAWLSKHLEDLKIGSPKELAQAIERSLRWKARAVKVDYLDRSGLREVLNFGHTFAHALEALTGLKKFQHGEAVVWGMRFALALSEVRGHLRANKREEWDEFLKRLPVPALPKNLSSAQVWALMKKDKKAQGHKVRFVLLKNLGRSVSDCEVRVEDVAEAFELLKRSR